MALRAFPLTGTPPAVWQSRFRGGAGFGARRFYGAGAQRVGAGSVADPRLTPKLCAMGAGRNGSALALLQTQDSRQALRDGGQAQRVGAGSVADPLEYTTDYRLSIADC